MNLSFEILRIFQMRKRKPLGSKSLMLLLLQNNVFYKIHFQNNFVFYKIHVYLQREIEKE